VNPSAIAASEATLAQQLRSAIRDIPDYPKEGVVFRDITPILRDHTLFNAACDAMAAPFASAGVTHVMGIESRGFILGGPVANRLGVGFVPARKSGKLPWLVERIEYALEYGYEALEAHRDGVQNGDRILVVDDVLATGGTAAAACRLVQSLGGDLVGCSFLVELGFLSGRAALPGVRVGSLLCY
jgi:adenine phosphoribosyltransferase